MCFRAAFVSPPSEYGEYPVKLYSEARFWISIVGGTPAMGGGRGGNRYEYTLLQQQDLILHWLGSLAQGEHVFVTVSGEGGFELTNAVGYSCFSVTNVD